MLLLGGMWQTLELQTRKIVEYNKHRLMEHSSRTLEDSSSESNVECGSLNQEVQRRTTGPFLRYFDKESGFFLLSAHVEIMHP